MIPIPIKELSELAGCEVEFARRQVYDGIKKEQLVKNVHWRSIRGAIVIDLECGLMFLALRRLRKEMGFLSKIVANLPQTPTTQKALKKSQRQLTKSQLAFELRAKETASKKLRIASETVNKFRSTLPKQEEEIVGQEEEVVE
jgi:hypothetical protein